MKLKRICAGLMAASIAIASLCVVAFAVEPSYKVSSDYKDTLYYNNLLAVELTGDGATDVIAVALSQLGYHEGNNQGDLEGGNAGGSKNFVEYNVLFGKLDNGEGNGYSYGYAWCAAFVNWCLRQARVDERSTGGMYVSCAAWRNWFIIFSVDSIPFTPFRSRVRARLHRRAPTRSRSCAPPAAPPRSRPACSDRQG